ncbi:MAG: hypothetical protein ACM3VT_16970 [Solirubrobacterales bacterium]
MRILLALLAMMLFLGAGCSGSEPSFYWFYPGRTFDEVKADYDECESQAEEKSYQTTEQEYFDNLRSPVILSGDEEAAKKSKKKRDEDPVAQAKEDWREMYKQKAFDGCMEGRGYIRLRPYQVDELKKKELPLGAIAGKKPDRHS